MKQPGRVVVITGGGSGMGRAIARRFAKNGDTVYVLGRRQEKLDETAADFPTIHGVVTDVTDIASIKQTCDLIVQKHKVVDVLINNAGISISSDPGSDSALAAQAWDEVIRTNLSGVFYVTFAFNDSLRRPGGRIINITSQAALGGSSRNTVGGQVYAASKAGIHGLSRTLMRDLAADGITINCIAPGVISDTEFFGGQGMSSERRQTYLDTIPVKRLGVPDDVAGAAFYLASEEAGFITGEILNVNGGAQFGR